MASEAGAGQRQAASHSAPSMHGPVFAFGSGCFVVFGVIYLVFVRSPYMFVSNSLFGALSAASWFLPERWRGVSLRATVFLVVVSLGLVNVVVHLGTGALPMVFWGMSVAMAAAFLHGRVGILAWMALCAGFYPLTVLLKTGPLAGRVIPLDSFQNELLSVATYLGLLAFLAHTFVLFRGRLDRALDAMAAHAAALRESESLLAESQRIAHIGSYDLDLVAGTWTSSAVFDEIHGIDAAYRRDVDGWLALVHPDDRPALRRHLELATTTAEDAFDTEYRLARCVQGCAVWVHGRGVRQRDASGRPTRLAGTTHDISEHKCDEEARRQLELRLFHAQKLESLGVLAGGIAHDFNNLLTGILGNVALARSVLASTPDEARAALGHAETAARRAAELTRQMLAFSGKGQFVVRPLDVNAAVREMVELLKSSVPKKIELRLALAPEPLPILADASQFRQVAMNLIINAAEAIGDAAGVITIRSLVRHVDAGERPAGLVDEELRAGDYVCLELVDTGCGMDEETRRRLFEPFFTTKFTGRGLGLAAVLGIVRGHSGGIALESAPRCGTTFTVYLPAAPADVVLPPSPPAAASDAKAGRGTVLVVDDEDLVRDLARAVLSRAGFRVLEAVDGLEAIELCRTVGGELDLVLLDLTMPKLGGIEALAELRRIAPALRVVLMSGYAKEEVLRLCADTGPDDFLEKPFHHGELLAVVQRSIVSR